MSEMLTIKDFFIIAPEIVIALGAIIIMLCASYMKCIKIKQACYLSICVLLLSIYCICDFSGESTEAFFGAVMIDTFAISLKTVIAISTICIMWVMSSLKVENKADEMGFEVPVLVLLSTVGMYFLISSKNLLTVYMGLELMSLPLYVLTACKRSDPNSQESGLKYFILGALASCIYLFGSSIIYGFSGSIDFTAINDYHTNISGEGAYREIPIGFLVGAILIIVSVFFKISAVPFHMWTPDVYQGSPTIITKLLASTPKIAALGLLLKILFQVFSKFTDQLQQILVFTSVASMFIGNLGAIMQKSFKRLLAYSTIGHVGFILMGAATCDLSGVQNSLFYAIMYVTMNLAIFSILLMLKENGKYKTEINHLSGLAKNSPLLAASITILMFSMAGIPPFAGFFAKFYILYSVIQQGMYLLALAGVIATVIGSYYYLRVIKIMYFDKSMHSNDTDIALSTKMVAGIGILINLLYVFAPEFLINYVERAAESLLGY